MASDRVVSGLALVVMGANAAAGGIQSETVSIDSVSMRVAAIERQLAADGFLWPRVSTAPAPGRDSGLVLVRVEPGPRARIGGWRLEGNLSLSDSQVLAALPRSGEPFASGSVGHALSAVTRRYAEAGRPFASATAASTHDSGPCVAVAVRVEEGPRAQVRGLAYTGQGLPGAALLDRVAGFAPATYSPMRVAVWRRRLEQSGLVTVDSERLDVLSLPGDDSVACRLSLGLTARRTNRAHGALAYSPGERCVVGSADVEVGNLLGTGRRLSASWWSGSGMLRIRASYREPWLLRTDASLLLAADHSVQDSTSADTRLSARTELGSLTVTSVNVSAGYDRATSSGRSGTTAWLGTGLVADGRECQSVTAPGVRLSVAVSGGTRVSQATSTAFVSRDELDVSGAARVGHAAAIVFRAGVRAVLSRADLLPLELYALGGTESVRGFREEQLRSWAVGWASLEPSFCMGSVSRVYPLADVGGYRDGDRWRPACGYGAGMRTAAGIGVVGLDYGVAFGDSPGRGKVHLSLQTEF